MLSNEVGGVCSSWRAQALPRGLQLVRVGAVTSFSAVKRLLREWAALFCAAIASHWARKAIRASMASERELRKKAKHGDSDAMEQLAILLSESDVNESLLWHKKAARAGNARAMYWWGRALITGDGDTDYDPRTGIKLWKASADADDVFGLWWLADAYRVGDVVGMNWDKAMELYERGVALGDGDACAALGEMVEARGEFGRAIELYEQAMRSVQPMSFGHRTCVRGLGRCYENGAGIEQDFALAEAIYEQCQSEVWAKRAIGRCRACAAGGAFRATPHPSIGVGPITKVHGFVDGYYYCSRKSGDPSRRYWVGERQVPMVQRMQFWHAREDAAAARRTEVEILGVMRAGRELRWVVAAPRALPRLYPRDEVIKHWPGALLAYLEGRALPAQSSSSSSSPTSAAE